MNPAITDTLATVAQTVPATHIMQIVGVWIGAFLTLMIFSFLFRDNPFYRIAEQLFIGLSAGYFFVIMFYDHILPNLVDPLSVDFVANWHRLIPALLGVMMLMRLVPRTAWMSRYPISLLIGTTAGISITRVMKSNVLNQLQATIMNPFAAATTEEMLGNLLLMIGTLTAFMYFYFSRRQEGILKGVSVVGIYFLMVSFGAAFGFTAMARISLLIGRLLYLFQDWLGVI